MQRAAKTSRFLIDFFSNRGTADSESLASHGDLLQYVFSRVARTANSHQVFNELVQRLTRLAEHAYGFRDANTLQEISSVLMSLPVFTAQPIGKYYQALAIRWKKQAGEAQSLLEAVAVDGPFTYRARAIQSLGALHHGQGQHAEALRLNLEAARVASGKVSRDSLAMLRTQLEISHIQSDFGDHKGALAILEGLSPLVHCVAKEIPFNFYNYQANLAYELAQVGRIAEAEAALSVALASPFVHAYPEWSETRDEIAALRQSASSSIVAVNRAPEATELPDAQPRRNLNPARAYGLFWLECGQRVFSSLTCVAIARCVSTLRATELLCDSNQPRAPPTAALSI